MKRTSIRKHHSVIAGAGVMALATAAITLQSATAAPAADPAPLTATAAGKLATTISSDLGADAAGSYYDAKDRKLVVNVLNAAAAKKVRAAGAEAQVVKHSLQSLDEARETLKGKATIPGTAWAMDPKLNKVVVTADRTVKSTALSRLNKAVSSLGDRATVRRTTGTIQPLIAGGDAIWGDSARCSLGFNVIRAGRPYFLTAGHCTSRVQTWSATRGGPEIASTTGSSFPSDDYGLAAYTANVAHPSAVNLYNGRTQPITRAGDPIVGQRVLRSGSTSRVHSGSVLAVNVTVNYAQGTVDDLIQTSVCAEPGDSGGSLFAGSTALGLTSGGSGDCTLGGQTYYQPVAEALRATGSRIG
ncbi:S1 family peptidase [Streptomyces sp. P1-3]|uniref:S1 family peptidase n=1 Tax=Streptomyces sp. P1-3 TaxID=3421658 RepID=UPI003D36C58A